MHEVKAHISEINWNFAKGRHNSADEFSDYLYHEYCTLRDVCGVAKICAPDLLEHIQEQGAGGLSLQELIKVCIGKCWVQDFAADDDEEEDAKFLKELYLVEDDPTNHPRLFCLLFSSTMQTMRDAIAMRFGLVAPPSVSDIKSAIHDALGISGRDATRVVEPVDGDGNGSVH